MAPKIAIACQGGGVHTAFTAGVLQGVLEHADRYWDGLFSQNPPIHDILRTEGPTNARKHVSTSITLQDPYDKLRGKSHASPG